MTTTPLEVPVRHAVGSTVEAQFSNHDGWHRGTVEQGGPDSGYVVRHESNNTTYWHSASDVRPVPEVAESTVSAEEVERLRNAVETITAERDRLLRNMEQVRTDLTRLGEDIKDTADRNEWCGEYDRLLDEALSRLRSQVVLDSFGEAARRQSDFTVTFTATQTVTVTARNELDALDEAREMIDAYSWEESDYDVEED